MGKQQPAEGDYDDDADASPSPSTPGRPSYYTADGRVVRPPGMSRGSGQVKSEPAKALVSPVVRVGGWSSWPRPMTRLGLLAPIKLVMVDNTLGITSAALAMSALICVSAGTILYWTATASRFRSGSTTIVEGPLVAA